MNNLDENIITKNINLIYLVLKKMNLYKKLDDYFDIGMIGLIKGLKKYNGDKGYAISTFLTKCIQNEILIEIRKSKTSKRLANYNALSLSEIYYQNDDNSLITLEDVIPSKIDIEGDFISRENIFILKEKINTLSKTEQFILKHLFGIFDYQKLSQKQIAKTLNISQSYVSRIKNKALAKLKDMMIKNL